KVRNDLDARIGKFTADIIHTRCTHVAGSFWNVWPAVFHANAILHERHEDRTVWGITFRAEVPARRWWTGSFAGMRVAVPREDHKAEIWLSHFCFPPMVVVENRPTIRILSPAPQNGDHDAD